MLSTLLGTSFWFVGYLNEDGFLNLPRFEKYLTALAQVSIDLLFSVSRYSLHYLLHNLDSIN